MGVSKIPENINKYAIEWAHKISDKPIECAKGIDFGAGKVLAESGIVRGSENQVDYNFSRLPKDIYIHNHPANTPLNPLDIDVAIRRNVKKIIASTSDGFCSIDFTTINKHISKSEMEHWNDNATKETLKTFEELNEKAKKPNANILELTMTLTKCIKQKLEEFAKFSGAIFEDVKWQDLEKLKS